MPPVLTGPVSLRVDGRLILRAEVVRGADGVRLREPDRTEIGLDLPVAALLTRKDLISALRPSGAELLIFRGSERRFRLLLRRRPGGSELLVRSPDGIERDAHQTPLRAFLLQGSGRG